MQSRSGANHVELDMVYLLFAGLHGDPRGGTGDLVATFGCPREARDAFRQVRLQLPDRAGWAELTAVSKVGVKSLCWFGTERQPVGDLARRLASAQPRIAATARTGGRRRQAVGGWARRVGGRRASAAGAAR